jgi:hypothetical protein
VVVAFKFIDKVVQIGFTLGLSLNVDAIGEQVRITESFPIIGLEGRTFPIPEIPSVDGRVWIEFKGRRLATIMEVQLGRDHLILGGLFSHIAQKTPRFGWLSLAYYCHS